MRLISKIINNQEVPVSGDGGTIEPIVRMSVNSSMTYTDALNAFAALIDFSKITPKSSFRIIETSGMSCFYVSGIMSNELRVTRINNGTSIKCIGFYIKTSSSMAYTTQSTTSGTTYTDDSSSALYSGYQAFELEY